MYNAKCVWCGREVDDPYDCFCSVECYHEYVAESESEYEDILPGEIAAHIG